MKHLPRAAVLAAVTLFAGAFANAATVPGSSQQAVPVQQLNPQNHHLVPLLPAPAETPSDTPPAPIAAAAPAEFATLSDAVDAQAPDAASNNELRCLAVGVYYEAKGEPLSGQLAVADVILNRTTSGRFPGTVCGVLTQHGQFSFVRHGQLPSPPACAAWRKAMAVAQVAQKSLWDNPIEGALYFHARYVSPGWKRPLVGTIGHHVFYR
jgi:spore germination cell wall hydrolase CwlJ-like protein